MGRLIGKWQKLPTSGKLIFLKASACLLLIKTGLTILPFSFFRKAFHWFTSTRSSKEFSAIEINRIVWAVDTAANLLPFELLCLPRALATKYLLREAPELTLEIGIEINPAKQFEAHAWVERNGNIIIGDWPKTISYQRIWVWE
ncbi:lasso peptide biosynthesis B2 protein [Dyadobacter sp. CY323]|uniref:lasso peptide biosynthesis B2 protein n=1 Tax=Dyadobacter sp. CY323 TaxID=2907302 RepID=UPI001F3FC866|nr:lasso peptide biosynthesis B2 protein [Dyadobacter sp. CY323]